MQWALLTLYEHFIVLNRAPMYEHSRYVVVHGLSHIVPLHDSLSSAADMLRYALGSLLQLDSVFVSIRPK